MPRDVTPRDLSEGPSSYRIMEPDVVRTVRQCACIARQWAHIYDWGWVSS